MLIIIGSSASVFILLLVICLLVLGCCCLINVRHKNKLTAERSSTPVTENPLASASVPIYEELLPTPIKSTENELNLKENVAYNSIGISIHRLS
jgi:hypothetical protein